MINTLHDYTYYSTLTYAIMHALAFVLMLLVPVSGICGVTLIAVLFMRMSSLLTRCPELVWGLVMPSPRRFGLSCITVVTVSTPIVIVIGILVHALITSRPLLTLACVSPAAFA